MGTTGKLAMAGSRSAVAGQAFVIGGCFSLSAPLRVATGVPFDIAGPRLLALPSLAALWPCPRLGVSAFGLLHSAAACLHVGWLVLPSSGSAPHPTMPRSLFRLFGLFAPR